MGTFQKNLSQVAPRGGKVSWLARSCLCCQSREGSRMLRLVLLFAALSCCLGAEFSTSESFVVKVGKTKKTATCDITISYEGTVVSEADSSVSCSVAWPKNKALNFAKPLSLTMGDVSADVFTADISMTLTKKSKKPASTLKTTIDSITVTGTVTPDPEFYPATLWCPAVDYFIWGQGAFDTSIVDESPATGFEECAQRCSEFTNEAGNSPCFSWTMNSNAGEALGLPGGNCRLLAYMNVSGIAFPGVQSGFHKCWNAAQTLNP